MVNDYNWTTYSDGPSPLPGDPYEIYASRALTGSADFDFWDMRKGWTYPPATSRWDGKSTPTSSSPTGRSSGAANGLDSSEDERIKDLADLLAGFHEAGGGIILAGWLMNFYLPPKIQQVLNVVDWDRPVSVTPTRLLSPQLPGLTPIGPAPDVSSAFNCAVPVFGPGGGIYTYYRLGSEPSLPCASAPPTPPGPRSWCSPPARPISIRSR